MAEGRIASSIKFELGEKISSKNTKFQTDENPQTSNLSLTEELQIEILHLQLSAVTALRGGLIGYNIFLANSNTRLCKSALLSQSTPQNV